MKEKIDKHLDSTLPSPIKIKDNKKCNPLPAKNSFEEVKVHASDNTHKTMINT